MPLPWPEEQHVGSVRASSATTQDENTPDAQVVPNPAIDGAALLTSIAGQIQRFVVVINEQAHALALWVVHTHAIKAAEYTPYLAITSAAKRSGKTTLLEVLALLVARPWLTGRLSAAVL